MRKFTYLIVLLSMVVLSSCNSSGKKNKEEAINQQSEKSEALTKCDDFLAFYEEWIGESLKVASDYFKNPSDEELALSYMQILQEATTWSTKWDALVDCADDEKYKQKFEEISDDLEKRLKDLGL